jgi:hypothetical protein
MLVTMSQKELNRIPVLQQICDKRLTQSAAANVSIPVIFWPHAVSKGFPLWHSIVIRGIYPRVYIAVVPVVLFSLCLPNWLPTKYLQINDRIPTLFIGHIQNNHSLPTQ